MFLTPVRPALSKPDHLQASALNRQLAGSGISRQAFNLRDKILQVDRWLPTALCPVVEVHPELSFGEMAGAPLADSKSTWAGAVTRHRLLAAQGIELCLNDLGLAGQQVGVDDVLDATAVAWTARRFAAAQHAACRPSQSASAITSTVPCGRRADESAGSRSGQPTR